MGGKRNRTGLRWTTPATPVRGPASALPGEDDRLNIVITARGETPEAPFDPVFGRAPKLVVCDLGDGACCAIDNAANAEAAAGAGMQVAERVIRLGAQGVVTGRCGPKAMQLLTAAGVAVYRSDALTVGDALARFRAGALERIG